MVHFNIEGNALKKKWWEGQAFVRIDRDSHPELFCKKGILKSLAKFTEKHLSCSPETFFKKDFYTGVFL